MATVRITDNIRSDVLHAVRQLFDKRWNEKIREVEAVPNLVMEAYEATYAQKERELAKELWAFDNARNTDRRKWVSLLESVDIYVSWTFTQPQMGDEPVATKQMSSRIRGSAAGLNLPAPSSGYYGCDSKLNLPDNSPAYAKTVALLAEAYKIEQDREMLIASIKQILNQCSTVRQLLEAWPSAINYLSKEVLARHNEKAPKREKAGPIEVDQATKSALLKATLLNRE